MVRIEKKIVRRVPDKKKSSKGPLKKRMFRQFRPSMCVPGPKFFLANYFAKLSTNLLHDTIRTVPDWNATRVVIIARKS